MLSNAEIAATFGLLADLMKLHGEEDFKVRSYEFASRNLKSVPEKLVEMNTLQLKSIKGIGDAIAAKIIELAKNGSMRMLDGYIERTPSGMVELLKIKGLGPSKLKTLWAELEIETPGELLYACYENRLLLLKGFGEKTQKQIQEQLLFHQKTKNLFRFHQLEETASDLVDDIKIALDTDLVSLTGEIRRIMPVLEKIELVVESNSIETLFEKGILKPNTNDGGIYYAWTPDDVPVKIFSCDEGFFGITLFKTTPHEEFLTALPQRENDTAYRGLTEEQIFEKQKLSFVYPEHRETAYIAKQSIQDRLPKLIEDGDIKGVLHAHSTWSDGSASIAKMAEASMENGYSWLGLTDHSKSAFYANGLSVERLHQQWTEIDALNQTLNGKFRVFKGIESDILYDGKLDYEEEILKKFDFIIASIHSTLRMDEEKATARLIKAIENPYTNILGHPTGRLLLSRAGYPINHRKVIDACAANAVSIELNCNPHRLDLDWSWIPYALDKGIWIAVNPDAHSTDGIKHIRYGVMTARKGGLTATRCLNTLTADGFMQVMKG